MLLARARPVGPTRPGRILVAISGAVQETLPRCPKRRTLQAFACVRSRRRTSPWPSRSRRRIRRRHRDPGARRELAQAPCARPGHGPRRLLRRRSGRPRDRRRAGDPTRARVVSVAAHGRPGGPSAGAGRALLERSLAYGPDTDAGLIISSSDPRALRLYALAGFALRPTLEARGDVDRDSLPPPDLRCARR